jgi:NAD(P)-dependent dehydrogenase (short-subunit alcohol dehydrogenase family)
MRERGGRIVLVIPTLAGFGAPGFVPQTAAAEGVRVLAKSAARRWGADGITVNCVAPDVATLAGRSGDAPAGADSALGRPPDIRLDIAPVVALLASDAARFVTGETLRVDGGMGSGT